MLIPPKYVLSQHIATHLQHIEACKQLIDSFPLPVEIEINLRRESILKSSLFSARIEGNDLTLDELPGRASSDQKKKEVFNILKALQFIHDRGARDVTSSVMQQAHQKTMEGLIDKTNLGKYRTEQSAIFNSAGIAIYLPPPPRQIPGLIEKLLKFINSPKERFIPIRAVLAHYTFEKIHPFLDGNGRLGRLLLHAVLVKSGYGMRGLISIEEYLDKNRSEYYRALEETERDVTGYIEFMLFALRKTCEEAKQLVLTKKKVETQDYLLPRRSEILNIIRDHTIINFDQIRRRFITVNPRTLRYDLKKLQEGGFIRKRGITNGVYYQSIRE